MEFETIQEVINHYLYTSSREAYQIADAAGVNRATLHRLLNDPDRKHFEFETIKRLARELDIPGNVLLSVPDVNGSRRQ